MVVVTLVLALAFSGAPGTQSADLETAKRLLRRGHQRFELILRRCAARSIPAFRETGSWNMAECNAS